MCWHRLPVQNPGNRAALAAQGAVNALMGALQSHPQHAGLQGAVRFHSDNPLWHLYL